MGMLDDLLGNEQFQKQFKDFVKRYDQGAPSEGYSDQEVLKRYGEVSHAVPREQYAQAAQEALARLSPEERAEFVEMLQERAAARGVNTAATSGIRSDGPGKGAHRSTSEARTAPGYSRRWRRAASGPSGRVEPNHRHAVVADGQGRARGHCGHGRQEHDGSVQNGVRLRRSIGI